MSIAQASKWCKNCGRKTLHNRNYFGGGWGCLLTILTGGLFIPIWLLIGLIQMFTQGWHCQFCGKRR
jgi:hypothetical protein